MHRFSFAMILYDKIIHIFLQKIHYFAEFTYTDSMTLGSEQ